LSINPADRRREPRYVVTGCSARLDGEACSVLDVSPSAVRLVRPASFAPSTETHTLMFEIEPGVCRLRVDVPAWIVRTTDVTVVLGYRKPFEGWHELLKSLDTFKINSLKQLFSEHG
jgi:hypothetical protein